MTSAGSLSTLLPVAAPVRVLARLSAVPDGPVEVVHASATAVYVDLDGWCLGVVSASASRVPCALWSTLDDLGDLAPRHGVTARVEGGALLVADRRLQVARVVDPRPSSLPDASSDVEDAVRQALPVVTGAGLEPPADGRLTTAHVDRLLGRGPGLTPLGDDVLAGWLTVRAAARREDVAVAGAVRHRLPVTTLLSATLLDCALHGEALPQLTDWLADPTPDRARALREVGATSGAGLLVGAGLALASLADETRSTVRPTAARSGTTKEHR